MPWYGKLLGAIAGALLLRPNPVFGAVLGMLIWHAFDADWFKLGQRDDPYRELGVGSLEELEGAVRSGRLRSLGGFGPKSEQRLLEAIMTVKLAHARRI